MLHPKIPLEQMRSLAERLIAEIPSRSFDDNISAETSAWLARAEVLIRAGGDVSDLVAFQVARSNVGTYAESRDRLLAPLLNLYHYIELLAPPAGQGRFIPPGDTWNGYAALVKILQSASTDLLIIDPYLDATFYTELLSHSASKTVRALTLKGSYHVSLKSAHDKWQSTMSPSSQSIETRYAPPKSLHDRLIIIDAKEVWLISQSLKDIAARAPAYVVQAEPELAELKRATYESIWLSAPLVG